MRYRIDIEPATVRACVHAVIIDEDGVTILDEVAEPINIYNKALNYTTHHGNLALRIVRACNRSPLY